MSWSSLFLLFPNLLSSLELSDQLDSLIILFPLQFYLLLSLSKFFHVSVKLVLESVDLFAESAYLEVQLYLYL